MGTKLIYSKTGSYFKFSKTQKTHLYIYIYTFQKLIAMITRIVNSNYSSSTMMSKLININYIKITIEIDFFFFSEC